MVELAGIRSGERILDVGCGLGRLAIVAGTAAGPDGETYRIDPAPEMVELARRKAAQAGVTVRFEVGVIEEVPYPPDPFDVVLSSLMLHHLPDELKRPHPPAGIGGGVPGARMTRRDHGRITLEIQRTEEGPYLGTSPDLPGLIVQGATPEQVVELAPDIARELISVMIETGQPLPAGLHRLSSPTRVQLVVPA